MESEPALGERLVVRLVGSLAPEFRQVVHDLRLEAHVTITGNVPYFESLKYQAASDALLLVDAPCDGPSVFLPSKLLEYLAFGKPILALTPPRGMSAGLVKQAGGIVVAPDDVNAIAQRLVEMWRQFERGQLLGHDFFPQSCEPSHVASVLADVLRRAASALSHVNSTENLERPLPLHLS